MSSVKAERFQKRKGFLFSNKVPLVLRGDEEKRAYAIDRCRNKENFIND